MDQILTAQDHVVYLNAADANPLNRSSRTDEKYGMMVVMQEATVSFTTTWKKGDGTLTTVFVDKVLTPGNYPRWITNVTVSAGEVWLLVGA